MAKKYNYCRSVGNTKTLTNIIIVYDIDSGPGQQLHSQSSPGRDLGIWLWLKGKRNDKFSLNGKLGHSCVSCARVTIKGLVF